MELGDISSSQSAKGMLLLNIDMESSSLKATVSPILWISKYAHPSCRYSAPRVRRNRSGSTNKLVRTAK
jgi:hypothetical protein